MEKAQTSIVQQTLLNKSCLPRFSWLPSITCRPSPETQNAFWCSQRWCINLSSNHPLGLIIPGSQGTVPFLCNAQVNTFLFVLLLLICVLPFSLTGLELKILRMVEEMIFLLPYNGNIASKRIKESTCKQALKVQNLT